CMLPTAGSRVRRTFCRLGFRQGDARDASTDCSNKCWLDVRALGFEATVSKNSRIASETELRRHESHFISSYKCVDFQSEPGAVRMTALEWLREAGLVTLTPVDGLESVVGYVVGANPPKRW